MKHEKSICNYLHIAARRLYGHGGRAGSMGAMGCGGMSARELVERYFPVAQPILTLPKKGADEK